MMASRRAKGIGCGMVRLASRAIASRPASSSRPGAVASQAGMRVVTKTGFAAASRPPVSGRLSGGSVHVRTVASSATVRAEIPENNAGVSCPRSHYC